MLIICKSCKKVIDTDKHDFCPKCGANFNYNKNLTAVNHTEDYEEYERSRAEAQRAAVENRADPTKINTRRETQRRLKNASNKADGKKNGCIGCFGVLIAMVVIFSEVLEDSGESFETFLNSFSDELGIVGELADKYIDEETAAFTTAYEVSPAETLEPPYEDEIVYDENGYVIASTGETVYMEDYSITLSEISEYKNDVLEAPEGYAYLSFTLKLTNTSDSTRFFYESISLHAMEDCALCPFSGLYLPGELEAGAEYERAVIFEVPRNALFLDLYYGEDVVFYGFAPDIEGYEPDWGYEYDGDDSQY